MNPDQREINIVPPGTLIREESYGDQKDHPDFAAYRQQNCDQVKTGEIMNHWTEQPIVSEGVSHCHVLIANRADTQAQAAHVSYDTWNLTPPQDLKRKLGEWTDEQLPVLMVHNNDAAINYHPRDRANTRNTLGDKLHVIPLNSKSRFGLVYDVKKKQLLVELTDDKLLRVYQGA